MLRWFRGVERVSGIFAGICLLAAVVVGIFVPLTSSTHLVTDAGRVLWVEHTQTYVVQYLGWHTTLAVFVAIVALATFQVLTTLLHTRDPVMRWLICEALVVLWLFALMRLYLLYLSLLLAPGLLFAVICLLAAAAHQARAHTRAVRH
jgi:hypothetical protein